MHEHAKYISFLPYLIRAFLLLYFYLPVWLTSEPTLSATVRSQRHVEHKDNLEAFFLFPNSLFLALILTQSNKNTILYYFIMTLYIGPDPLPSPPPQAQCQPTSGLSSDCLQFYLGLKIVYECNRLNMIFFTKLQTENSVQNFSHPIIYSFTKL